VKKPVLIRRFARPKKPRPVFYVDAAGVNLNGHNRRIIKTIFPRSPRLGSGVDPSAVS
jgi:hypothetical protein